MSEALEKAAVRVGWSEWTQPRAASDVLVAFPASVKGYLPPLDAIPDEFKRHPGTQWNRLFNVWFFRGLERAPLFKAGIDAQVALRHLHICMGSFEPKHEHKEAGVAYLLSLWCEPADPAPTNSEVSS